MDPLVSRAMQTLLMRSMRAAVSLEATHYVLHGGNMPLYLEWIVGLPRRKALRVLVETVKPLMRVAADGGVRVVCENIWVKEDCFSHPEHLFETMRLTGAGYCLDIAHAELTGQRRVLSKRLPDCVHAADTKLEARDDMHLNIGEGNLDYAWWMKQLRHMGFDGKIILECKEVVESRKRITALWQER
jgi:sugar phosphate isomerase/epimerase